MAGKPRMAGASRARTLQGSGCRRARDRIRRRNARQIVALIEAGEFTAFPNARCFILAVKAAGIPVACTCLRRTRMRSERAGPDRA